jgi:hypothetical protein
LYILKTHKKHLDLFKKIQGSKNFEEFCDYLEIREIYDDIVKENPNITGHYDTSFLKERFKKKV